MEENVRREPEKEKKQSEKNKLSSLFLMGKMKYCIKGEKKNRPGKYVGKGDDKTLSPQKEFPYIHPCPSFSILRNVSKSSVINPEYKR